MHRSTTRERRPARGALPLGALGALFALLMTFVPATAALAVAPPSGTYTGESSAYNGATVEFTIDGAGQLTEFHTESYIQCGLFPTPMQWAGVPATPVTAGEPFDLEWEFDVDGIAVVYELENMAVNADGTASGEGRASIPDLFCAGYRFTFTAEVEGGGGPPEPQPDPEISVSPSELSESELATTGVSITGTEFPANADVALTVAGTEVDTSASDADGGVSFGYVSDSLGTGTHEVTLTSGAASASTSFTVTADPQPEPEPTASVSPGELTVSELSSTGVSVTGADFPAGADVALTVGGEDGGTQTADAAGGVSFAFTSGSLGAGTYTVNLTSGSLLASTSVNVVPDPEPEPEPIATVSPGELTVSELASTGVTITGADFPSGVDVTLTVAGTEAGTQTADDTGAVSFTYTSDTLGTGAHEATLTTGAASASTSFTVTADPEPEPEPTAAVSPSELTESALADTGVTITGTDFPSGADVTLTVAGTEAGTQTADDTGAMSFTYTSDTLGTGTHEVTLTTGAVSASTSFAVTADPEPEPEPIATVSPGELTVSELASTGVTITGTDFPSGVDVTLTVAGTEAGTQTTDTEGNVSFAYTSDTLGTGTHEVTLTSGSASATTSLTVTADPEPEPEPVASVSPGELTVSELASTGVTITGTDFPASAEVTLTVAGTEADTQTADTEGNVSFTYTSDTLGTGTHEATLTTGAVSASTSFTVTADPDPDPVTIPGETPDESDLTPETEGGITAPASAEPGETIGISVDGADEGVKVGAWIFSEPEYLGTRTVDAEETIEVTVPASTDLGEHRLAVWAEDETLIGWTTIQIVSDDDEADADSDASGGSDDDADGSSDSGTDGDASGGSGSGASGDAQGGSDSGSDASGGSGPDSDGSGSGSDSDGDGGSLPRTGGSATGLIAAAGVLLALGAGLLYQGRRRRLG